MNLVEIMKTKPACFMLNMIGKNKVYFQSLGFYMGLMNFFMIIANFSKLNNIGISLIILLPSVFVVSILWAKFDYCFIQPFYYRHLNKKNDIKYKIDDIDRKLDKLLEERK